MPATADSECRYQSQRPKGTGVVTGDAGMGRALGSVKTEARSLMRATSACAPHPFRRVSCSIVGLPVSWTRRRYYRILGVRHEIRHRIWAPLGLGQWLARRPEDATASEPHVARFSGLFESGRFAVS